MLLVPTRSLFSGMLDQHTQMEIRQFRDMLHMGPDPAPERPTLAKLLV